MAAAGLAILMQRMSFAVVGCTEKIMPGRNESGGYPLDSHIKIILTSYFWAAPKKGVTHVTSFLRVAQYGIHALVDTGSFPKWVHRNLGKRTYFFCVYRLTKIPQILRFLVLVELREPVDIEF